MAYKERLQQNNTDLNEILADLDQLPNMPTPNPPAAYQNLEVTENGTYTAGAGYDAIGQVTVDVAGESIIANVIFENDWVRPVSVSGILCPINSRTTIPIRERDVSGGLPVIIDVSDLDVYNDPDALGAYLAQVSGWDDRQLNSSLEVTTKYSDFEESDMYPTFAYYNYASQTIQLVILDLPWDDVQNKVYDGRINLGPTWW